MVRQFLRAGLASLLLCATACGGGASSSDGSGCTAGQSISCACASGAAGAQVCQANQTFSPCSCLSNGGVDAGKDAASDAGRDAASVSDGAVSDRKRVFVTSASYSGNLVATGNGSSALDAADKLCAAAAASVPLGGRWKSWLSDAATNAIDRIDDVGPWYQLDGHKTFNDKAGLRSSALVRLSITEQGVDSTSATVWTGTETGGLKSPSRCSDWTVGNSGSVRAQVGSTSYTSDWTATTTFACVNLELPIYCFEQ